MSHALFTSWKDHHSLVSMPYTQLQNSNSITINGGCKVWKSLHFSIHISTYLIYDTGLARSHCGLRTGIRSNRIISDDPEGPLRVISATANISTAISCSYNYLFIYLLIYLLRINAAQKVHHTSTGNTYKQTIQHLCYGIEIYGNTYNSYLNKLIILNNKILRILQNESIATMGLSYCF